LLSQEGTLSRRRSGVVPTLKRLVLGTTRLAALGSPPDSGGEFLRVPNLFTPFARACIILPSLEGSSADAGFRLLWARAARLRFRDWRSLPGGSTVDRDTRD